MERIITFLILATLLCTRGSAQNSVIEDRPTVITNQKNLADITQMIADTLVEIVVLDRGDESNARSILALQQADLNILDGAAFGPALDRAIATSKSRVPIIYAEEVLKSLTASADTGTVALTMAYIRNIRDALIELDTFHRRTYEFNAGVYLQQLEDRAAATEQPTVAPAVSTDAPTSAWPYPALLAFLAILVGAVFYLARSRADR